MAGRKPIPIDLKEVSRLAGLGLTEIEICHALDIDNSTLTRRKHNAEFAQALKSGKAKAHAFVANVIFKAVRRGNIAAAIWYEKTRCGLNERLTLEGSQEKPIVLAAVGRPDSLATFAPGSVGDSNLIGEGQDDSGGTPMGENGARRSDGFR